MYPIPLCPSDENCDSLGSISTVVNELILFYHSDTIKSLSLVTQQVKPGMQGECGELYVRFVYSYYDSYDRACNCAFNFLQNL